MVRGGEEKFLAVGMEPVIFTMTDKISYSSK